MGVVVLGVAGWMTIIPPIIWLARFVQKYRRGVVSLLVLLGLLSIIVASIVIGSRSH
jgi:ABC-type uncharacterized transport system permease subunit